jgi:hypothetical protein
MQSEEVSGFWFGVSGLGVQTACDFAKQGVFDCRNNEIITLTVLLVCACSRFSPLREGVVEWFSLCSI